MKDILHAPPFITLLESGMKGWVMDGIAREAPTALNLENRTLYLPTRSIHRVRHRPVFWKLLNRSDSIILFLHHQEYVVHFVVDYYIYQLPNELFEIH